MPTGLYLPAPAGHSTGTRFPAFHAKAADRARATCTPGTAWPAIRASARLSPGTGIIAPVPVPFHPLDASAVVHSRSPSRSPPDASTGAFSSSLTATAFSQRSMRQLEASLRRATPKGHETFIFRTAPHQGLVPTSGPPCVQDTHRHPQVHRHPVMTRSTGHQHGSNQE